MPKRNSNDVTNEKFLNQFIKLIPLIDDIKSSSDSFQQLFIDLSSRKEDLIKWMMCLEILSYFPGLLIDVSGILYVTETQESRKTKLKRWLKENEMIVEKKIRKRILKGGIHYQTKEKPFAMIAIDSGSYASYFIQPGTDETFEPWGRPRLGYRVKTLNELTAKAGITIEEFKEKLQEHILAFITYSHLETEKVFTSKLNELLLRLMNESPKIEERLLWLIKSCGLGYRFEGTEAITTDLEELVKINEKTSRPVRKETDTLIDRNTDVKNILTVIQNNPIRLTRIQKIEENLLAYMCPNCFYQNAMKEIPKTVELKCALCGIPARKLNLKI